MREKSGTKKGHSAPQFVPDFLTRCRIILEALELGEISMRIRETMTKQYGISKSLYSQDIQQMIHEGWLIDANPLMNKYKSYKVTESGHTVLLGWENREKKTLTKIENARHVCKIRNTKFLNSFLSKESYGFERQKFNNVKFYQGRIGGMAIGIYIGNEVTMLITPQPMYARDLVTGHHKIHQTMIDFCNEINKKWSFELTIPEPTTHRQYTISDQFAEDMLKLSGGSQIKFQTNEGGMASIDMSPRGKEKRFEVDSLEFAQKYLETPDLVKILINKTNEHNEIITSIVKSQITLTDGINILSEKIGQFINLLQVKSGQEQVKPIDLTRDSKRMFG